METITHERAVALLEQIAEDRELCQRSNKTVIHPHSKLPVCTYWDEDAPACLIGHALNELGVDWANLPPALRYRSFQDLQPWLAGQGFTFEPKAIMMLQQAQRAADRTLSVDGGMIGRPDWGWAIHVATRTVPVAAA